MGDYGIRFQAWGFPDHELDGKDGEIIRETLLDLCTKCLSIDSPSPFSSRSIIDGVDDLVDNILEYFGVE